jgi:hypothetical protein
MSGNELKLDALYTIFEKHLYDFKDGDDSEEALIEKIVEDYLSFLVSSKVAVPQRWRAQIAEELKEQVRRMLLKKMYGCLSISEFIRNEGGARAERRKSAKKKYRKLF